MELTKSEVVGELSRILDEDRDMFFSCGDVDQDYKLIMDTLKVQGYWAGSKYKYFFDKEFNLTDVEERRFG